MPPRPTRRRKLAAVLAMALMSLPLQGCAEMMLIAQIFRGISALVTGGSTIYSSVQRLTSSPAQQSSPRVPAPATQRPPSDTSPTQRPRANPGNRSEITSLQQRSLLTTVDGLPGPTSR